MGPGWSPGSFGVWNFKLHKMASFLHEFKGPTERKFCLTLAIESIVHVLNQRKIEQRVNTTNAQICKA